MLPDNDALPQPERFDQPAAKPRSRIYYGWYLLAAAAIISVAARGARESFMVFTVPMSQELGWSHAMFAAAMVIGQLANGVTQPIVGYLFDRFDARKVILTSVVAAGLATAGLYWTYHYWHLLFLFSFVFSIAMGGVSLAILWPLAARWFVKRLGLALGLLTAVQSLGSALMVPMPALFLAQYGWRVGWLALGVVPLEVRTRGSAGALQRGRFEVDRWWRAFRSPVIWALLPGLAAGGFAGSVMSTFMPFAVDHGYSLTMASTIHSVMVLLGVVGAVTGGWLADRFARKKVLGGIYIAQGIAFLALVAGSQTPSSLWAFAVVGGLCSAAWMPIAFALVVDVYGLRALGAIWGIAFLCQPIGSVVGPVLSGLLYELTGYFTLLFAAYTAMLILAAIPALAINERKYSVRYRAAAGADAVGN